MKPAVIPLDDKDVLLALAGKLTSDLQQFITQHPKLFAYILRQLKEAPDHAILRAAREAKDKQRQQRLPFSKFRAKT